MGRSPCCEKVGLKKGPWTPDEDNKLLSYIDQHGHGSWRSLPSKAGLERCGKSCRLRWTNYLRPDIKRGKFSPEEEQTIIQLHALLGNRWSAIATHLPKRTDNEIKNYWNTHLKKKLAKSGIDPVTHKPKTDALILSGDGQSKKNTNILSHMAQWESARLEAEARLAKQSKLRSASLHDQLGSPAPSFSPVDSAAALVKLVAPSKPPSCLEILKDWKVVWNMPEEGGGGGLVAGLGGDLDSPTSTRSFSGNAQPVPTTAIGSCEDEILKEGGEEDLKCLRNSTQLPDFNLGMENPTSGAHEMTILPMEDKWTPESLVETNGNSGTFAERYTELLLNSSGDRSCSEGGGGESDSDGNGGGDRNFYDDDNKNYWDDILNLVNFSPSDSPIS